MIPHILPMKKVKSNVSVRLMSRDAKRLGMVFVILQEKFFTQTIHVSQIEIYKKKFIKR